MEKKQKLVALFVFIGIPLLLVLTAPHPKKITSSSVADDASMSQPQAPVSTSISGATQNSSSPTQTNGTASVPSPAAPSTYTTTPLTTPASPPASLSAPATAPSAWTQNSGFLTGTYHYVVTYVSTSGQETIGSPASLGVSPNNQQVWITNIPTGPEDGVEERNLYRTLANGSMVGPYYLLTSFNDNVTRDYYDNTPDDVLKAGTLTPRYF